MKKYKYNLINLHIDDLLPKSIKNKYYYTIISTVIFFHHEYEKKIYSLILKDFKGEEFKNYRNSVKYIHCWGKDSLTQNKLDDFLNITGLNKPSKLFSDDLYFSFRRYLQPPLHMLEEGKYIKYTPSQEELIRSEQRPKRKIKGLAGCGKTFVLAKRAVNAYLRTNSKILILTYNLSLKNYIHDRINDVREEFPWKNFYITNYHQFFKQEANNLGLEIKNLGAWSDTNFFESVQNNIKKYQAIFIDEIQDYETSWLKIIDKYFLEEDGEFVVFGDEKQNIYDRPLDEQGYPTTIGIKGNWNESLKAPIRSDNNLVELALKFQKELMSHKYSVDELHQLKQKPIGYHQIRYFNFGIETTASDLYDNYIRLIKECNIHPSDICILSAKVEYLRELDYIIRQKLKENTTTTFETREFLDKLKKEIKDESLLHQRIEDIRRNKKNHFWLKTGTTKLSSIHSFKGWESHTVFLIIEPEENGNQFESIELVYTGVSRAQHNLFVFNMGNSFYDDFFKKQVPN